MATTRTKPQTSEAERPSTEVQPMQRPFSPAQRLAILAEYESYPRGDTRRGELLRRHGIYTSHMTKWREQRDRGTLTSHTQPLAGRPVEPRAPQADELARLQRENARLQTELEKAQLVIDVQKKIARLLGMSTSTPPSDGAS
jgi:transposase